MDGFLKSIDNFLTVEAAVDTSNLLKELQSDLNVWIL